MVVETAPETKVSMPTTRLERFFFLSNSHSTKRQKQTEGSEALSSVFPYLLMLPSHGHGTVIKSNEQNPPTRSACP